MIPEPKSNPVLEAALEFNKWGCSVVPASMDGSKRPAVDWKEFQSSRAGEVQIRAWFQPHTGATGVGVITGKVSGNLEMLEMEGRAVVDGLLDEAKELAINSGLGDIWNVMINGYSEMTPSGGIHWLYRIVDEDVPPNTKIAKRPSDSGGIEVLVETRGEGGFVITAPSHGTVHPSGGAWKMLRGSPETIPSISWEERESLHLIFGLLDKMPTADSLIESSTPKVADDGRVKAGDDYNAKTDWNEILIPLGWKRLFTSKGVTYWRRPEKDIGISATTGRNEADNLYVFTTSSVFEAEKPYSKFSAFTLLKYGSLSQENFRSAASHLRQLGFGSIAVAQERNEMQTAPSGFTISVAGMELIKMGLSTPEIEIAKSEKRLSGDANETEAPAVDETEFLFQLNQARIRRRVTALLDQEEALKNFDPFVFIDNAEEELALPEVETPFTIQGIFPRGANITLTAMYKAGKTTLVNNLAKALVDETPFLNYFKKANHNGRVVMFNYEVEPWQWRRWVREMGIVNLKRLTFVHRRGDATPLIVPEARKAIIEQLKRLECETWIVDPFHRAFTGSGDENSNGDVGQFVEFLDIIKEKAGVSNLILPVHTGRAQEMGIDRARGATRIDDWADVRWLYKKTDDGRFFSADGRDVLLEEQQMKFDPNTRLLTLGGADARTAKKMNAQDSWIDAVSKNEGRTTREICASIGKAADDKGLQNARKNALAAKLVKTNSVGSAVTWWLIGSIMPTQQTIESAS